MPRVVLGVLDPLSYRDLVDAIRAALEWASAKTLGPREDRDELREVFAVVDAALVDAVADQPFDHPRVDLCRNALHDRFDRYVRTYPPPAAVLFPEVEQVKGPDLLWKEGLEGAVGKIEVTAVPGIIASVDTNRLVNAFREAFFRRFTERAALPSSSIHRRFSVIYFQLLNEGMRRLQQAHHDHELWLRDQLRRLEDLVSLTASNKSTEVDDTSVAASDQGTITSTTPEAAELSDEHVSLSPTPDELVVRDDELARGLRLAGERQDEAILGVYVPPTLLFETAGTTVRLSVRRAVAAFNHFTLSGEWGSGKTTLCHVLAMATRGLIDDLNVLTGMTPLLVQLGHLTEGDLFSVPELWLPEDAWAAAQRGRLLLLLDGLDEVSSPELRHRAEVLAAHLFETLPSGNRIVLTTRPLGDAAARMGVARLTIAPFDAEQGRRMLERLLRGRVSDDARAVLASGDLSSPLQLRLAVTVLRDTGQFPGDQHALLRTLARAQLRRALIQRQGEPAVEATAWIVLRRLASLSIEDGPWIPTEQADLVAAESVGEARPEAGRLVVDILVASSLLERVGDALHFSHRAVAEALAENGDESGQAV